MDNTIEAGVTYSSPSLRDSDNIPGGDIQAGLTAISCLPNIHDETYIRVKSSFSTNRRGGESSSATDIGLDRYISVPVHEVRIIMPS